MRPSEGIGIADPSIFGGCEVLSTSACSSVGNGFRVIEFEGESAGVVWGGEDGADMMRCRVLMAAGSSRQGHLPPDGSTRQMYAPHLQVPLHSVVVGRGVGRTQREALLCRLVVWMDREVQLAGYGGNGTWDCREDEPEMEICIWGSWISTTRCGLEWVGRSPTWDGGG